MLKIADPIVDKPKSYVAICAFTGDKFLITPEKIFVEFQEEGVMFVIAYVGQKLIFSQQCSSVFIDDQNCVKRLPTIKKVTKPKEEK